MCCATDNRYFSPNVAETANVARMVVEDRLDCCQDRFIMVDLYVGHVHPGEDLVGMFETSTFCGRKSYRFGDVFTYRYGNAAPNGTF